MVVQKLAVGGADPAAVEVDRRHLTLEKVVARRSGRVAERIGDGMRRQLAGAHLIEQRREEVIVLPVDERHRGLAGVKPPLEPADEVQAAEPATEYHDLLRRAQFAFPEAASTRSSSAR